MLHTRYGIILDFEKLAVPICFNSRQKPQLHAPLSQNAILLSSFMAPNALLRVYVQQETIIT